ncbi:O-methyltransferas-like protein family 3 [Lophiostoma macrostomum CBS 122681]|uniref:O-methyltransferas-like protein family 3 n=1 Tax=Lophiostoma macrostomum CBS 122681 TaxID=1314788 RepID=A0A6A6T668_9PLEO|nr:O-methyltransferas-like protein family 3 [Lophiostoma macrostomum CBS 122681]
MSSHHPEERWVAVDNYGYSHLHPKSSTEPSNDALEYALRNTAKEGLPDIAVSPLQGKFLKIQAQLVRAKSILEVGTLGGYSTIWLASSSPDVKVVSVEVNDHHAEVARANIANAGFGDRVEVKHGPGVDVIPRIAEEVKQGKRGKLDLVFIDADKENNWNYVDLAIGISHPGTLIIVDNVVRQGLLAQADTGNSRVEGARRVVEKVGQDERLDGLVLQTVGEKSYDGFLIAIVK